MKIISWNVCCLPDYANLYQNPKYVIENIVNILENIKADVICLQEIFDTYSIEIIKSRLSNYNIIYDTKGPKSFINSGLMMLSKHPILNYGYHEYSSKCGEDRLSCKGFLYCVYKYNNKDVVVYNTHLNNDTPIFNIYSDSIKIINKQLTQLFIHVYRTSKYCKDIIACGDYNCEPYFIGKFINTFYATQNLHIRGFSIKPTLCDEEKAIDHILYISGRTNNNISMKQNYLSLPLFSDHLMIQKEIYLE